jgi:hypothetical protein
MSFTEFLPRATMPAHELQHSVHVDVPLHIACLLRDELDTPPAHRGSWFTSWYGDAVRYSPTSRLGTIPFALRIFQDGNAKVSCRFQDRDAMAESIAELVPMIVAEPTRCRSFARMG